MQEESSYKPTDDISSNIEDLSSSSLQSFFSPIITVYFYLIKFVIRALQLQCFLAFYLAMM